MSNFSLSQPKINPTKTPFHHHFPKIQKYISWLVSSFFTVTWAKWRNPKFRQKFHSSLAKNPIVLNRFFSVLFLQKSGYEITKVILLFLQIEREKADLSVQVIQLSERLEEAEGGAESQVLPLNQITIFVLISTFSSSKLTKNATLSCWSCVNSLKMSILNQKKLQRFWRGNIRKLLLISKNRLIRSARPNPG